MRSALHRAAATMRLSTTPARNPRASSSSPPPRSCCTSTGFITRPSRRFKRCGSSPLFSARPLCKRFRNHDLFATNEVDDGGLHLQLLQCEIVAEDPGPVLRQLSPEHSLPIGSPDIRPLMQSMCNWIAAEHLR